MSGRIAAISVHCQCIIRLFAYCKGGNLIFISGCGSAISSAQEGKSGFIYNLVKS